MATSLVSAYENGEPWLGYYWAPTWVFAVVDLTMIEEPEYTDECWAIQDEEWVIRPAKLVASPVRRRQQVGERRVC
ncbi:MAG: glycine betaine ABC transporter substrate-binding protein [Thermomicrobiales bacterium]